MSYSVAVHPFTQYPLLNTLMDSALFFWLNDLAGRWWLVDEWWRFWGNDYIVPSLLVGILALGWCTAQAKWRVGLLCGIIALGLANLIVAISNALWFRARPFTDHDVTLLFYYPSDSGFPSNSAAVVWALAWSIALIAPRLRPVLGLALLMGIARIWIGIHYPLDIVGGAVVGIVAASFAWMLRRGLARLADGLVWFAGLLKLA